MSQPLSQCRLTDLLLYAEAEIAAADNLHGLYSTICEVLVGIGGFCMAWVGLVGHGEDKAVRTVAHAGYNSNHVQSVKISWAEDRETGNGPIAIRQGGVQVVNDIENEPNMRHRRARWLKRGYRSCIVVPLQNQGDNFGVLIAYSQHVDWFGDAEEEVFDALGKKVSLAAEQLRMAVYSRLLHG